MHGQEKVDFSRVHLDSLYSILSRLKIINLGIHSYWQITLNSFLCPSFLPTSKEYMDNVKKFYLASVESVDFQNAAEETRKKINSWVESQTNGSVWELSHLKNKTKHFWVPAVHETYSWHPMGCPWGGAWLWREDGEGHCRWPNGPSQCGE